MEKIRKRTKAVTTVVEGACIHPRVNYIGRPATPWYSSCKGFLVLCCELFHAWLPNTTVL